MGTEEIPIKDKAYRKYAAGVEKTLSLFETALEEWADYISFLNKLLKVCFAPTLLGALNSIIFSNVVVTSRFKLGHHRFIPFQPRPSLPNVFRNASIPLCHRVYTKRPSSCTTIYSQR